MERISQLVNKAIINTSAFMIIGMTLIVWFQIILRYVFNSGISWSEEISKLLMVWYAVLCAAVVLYHEGHVAIKILFDRMKENYRTNLNRLFLLLIAGFSLVLLIYGAQYTIDNFSIILPASGLTKFWLYFPLPLAGLVMILHTVTLFLRTFKNNDDDPKNEFNSEGGAL